MSNGDAPKRHHFVPETYLQAWCDAEGRVAVRRRDQDETFLTNPVNVGDETRLYGDGIEGLWREKNFKLVEAKWPRLRNDLVQRGHLQGHDGNHLLRFVRVQARENAWPIYDVDMSAAADVPQELVVDGPLADELERRGVHVHAGDRVRLHLVHDQERTDEQTAAWEAFFGSFSSGDPHYAERSEEILRAEFGR